MTKPISSTVHGVLDYMTAGFLFALPRVLGWNRSVTNLLDGAGAMATGYSLMTRYELGVVRVLPMKVHLTLDALSGGALLGAAMLMDDEEPEVRATVGAIGLWEIAASLMTRTQSGVERRRKLQRAASALYQPVPQDAFTPSQRTAGVLQGL